MADQKLTALTAIGTPTTDDLLYMVDDPGGTPLSRKMTIAQLQTLIVTLANLSGLGANIATALGIAVGSAGAPVTNGGALGTPASGTLSSAINGSVAAYLNYQEQQAQNTAGGTFSSGAWRTRVLNTEVADLGGYGSLAGNQITLAAGTYIVVASAPAWAVLQHQVRLQNVTDAATLVTGDSTYTAQGAGGVGAVNRSSLRGIFTIGASKAIELQHQCNTTKTTDGFGVAGNFTTEVYAIVELWKIG